MTHKEALAKTINDYIERKIAQAPPLSAEQRIRLSQLLTPIPVHIPEESTMQPKPIETKFPEHVSGVSPIKEAIPNQPVIQPKKRTRGRNKPKNGQLTTVTPNPLVYEHALQLASRITEFLDVKEIDLLRVEADGSVTVLNNLKGRR